jgi:hypothetical protein
MNSSSNNNNVLSEECLICLQQISLKGGQPVTSPGCCGKIFHQACLDQLKVAGIDSCPNCRKSFTNQNPVQSTPSASNQQPNSQSWIGSVFNRVRSSTVTRPSSSVPAEKEVTNDSLEEDIISTEVSKSKSVNKDDVTASPDNANITISCQPERFFLHFLPINRELLINSIIGVYRDSIPILGSDGFFVNIKLRASIIESARRVPIDIVCVLDNSGSMSGGKLESVKEASK